MSGQKNTGGRMRKDSRGNISAVSGALKKRGGRQKVKKEKNEETE